MKKIILTALLVLACSTCFADGRNPYLPENNPYYSGNPWAGAINGFMSGMKESEDRNMIRQKHEVDIANADLERQLIELRILNQKAELNRRQEEAERLDKFRNQLLVRISPTTEQLFMPGGNELSAAGRTFMPTELLGDIPQMLPTKDMTTQVPNPAYEQKQTIMQLLKEKGSIQIAAPPLTASEVLIYRIQGDPLINAVIDQYLAEQTK